LNQFTCREVGNDSKSDPEFIQVNQARKVIRGKFYTFRYTDRDTNQIMLYIPSIDVSGYGETEEMAKEILHFNMQELFKFLLAASGETLHHELKKLNWKKNRFASKQFSRSVVDINGDLREFNAVDNKVERLLTAV
jgi:hypothetical protein